MPWSWWPLPRRSSTTVSLSCPTRPTTRYWLAGSRTWAAPDPAAFEGVCHRDVHYEDPLTAEPLEGPERLGKHAGRLWAAFPDARVERTGERLANKRFVTAPCKLLATHKAPLEGLPAT